MTFEQALLFFHPPFCTPPFHSGWISNAATACLELSITNIRDRGVLGPKTFGIHGKRKREEVIPKSIRRCYIPMLESHWNPHVPLQLIQEFDEEHFVRSIRDMGVAFQEALRTGRDSG
ncbi:hypothetical protein V1477_014327 [Vespula maculifrons]|uniref:Uncharacterized protein n=2 Tax=Vespula TaxID=7451 RepID=A0A834KSJ6_VESVU|nr:hypothetical protein HZH66_000551 [Vespula vulgaris]